LILGVLHGEFKILLEWILVLLEPAEGFVLDGSSVMSETEVVLAETGLLEEWVALVVLVELGEEGVIVGLGDDALFVEEDEDTVRTLVDEIDGGLRVKTEVDEGPVDLFTEVLFLFELEHVVVEELLELLVGVVDADLLEGVLLEDFETSNIEDTNERVGSLLVEDLVGTLDDPQEETSEDGLGERISGVGSLLDGEVSLDELSTGLNAWLAERFLELSRVDTEELGSDFKGLLVGDGGSFSESLGEGDVTQVEDGQDDLEDGVLLALGDTANFHCDLGVLELLGIVESVDAGAATVVQVGELFWWEADKSVLLLSVGSGEDLVEDVEGSLALALVNDSGLLEQVDLETGSGDETRSVELESDEFTETRRVVVLVGLGVTESLEHGIEFHQLVLEGSLLSSATTSDVGDVLNDLLGVFSLTSTRLSSNEERLVLAVVQHGTVSTVGNGEDVRSDLAASLTTVQIDHEVSVDGEQLVRVDHDTEKSGVGIDDVTLVSLAEIVQDGGLTQVGQLTTILNTVELGWIHLVDLVLLELELLALLASDNSYSSRRAENLSGNEASFLVRDPGHLLVSEGGDREARVSGVLAVLVIVGLFSLSSSASHGSFVLLDYNPNI